MAENDSDPNIFETENFSCDKKTCEIMTSAEKWLYIVPEKKKYYVLVLTLIQAFAGSLGVLYALFFRNGIDSAVKKDAKTFRHYIFLIIILVLVQIFVSMITRWLREFSAADIENTFKSRLLNKILHKDYSSVSAIHTAEWLNRLTSDTAIIASGYVEILPGLCETFVKLFSALAMIIFMDKRLAYILIPSGIIFIMFTFLFRKILRQLHKNIQEQDGLLKIFLQERLGSLIIIRSFGAEYQTELKAAEKMMSHKNARMRRNYFSNFCNAGFSFAMHGIYLLSVIYCANGIMTGTVSYGTLTAIMQLIGQIQAPFANMSGYLPKFYAITASAERLMEVEKFSDELETMSKDKIQNFYRQNFISFGLQDTYFCYEPKKNILNGLSLEIKKGEYVAFTGHSGCGKSTVLKLLMSMYSLENGERFIFSTDGREKLTASWRKLFAYVPQGNFLMNGTIREIISFSDPTVAQDNARLNEALKIACADEFVNDVDTILGELGTGLSEGQMQRIAIARAIFSECPILLLDEATSGLDEQTEKRLIENLRNLTDKTVIIVTHRPSVLSICDRVLKFSDGGNLQ